MNNTTPSTEQGLMSLLDAQTVSLVDLAVSEKVQQLISTIKLLNPRKQKIGINEMLIFIPEHSLNEEVAENVSKAILASEEKTAIELWEICNADLKYEMLMPDRGVINIDIVKKIDITGVTIRTAYLAKNSIIPPDQTPYSYIYGNTGVEDALALVLILKQLQKMKPEGQMIIQEFFEEIDLRILYLFAMSEAEQYAQDDPDGGAYLQLAMDANDKIPEQLALLSWLQSYVPMTFAQLRETLLDAVWQENRSLFWKGWIRQNRSEMNEDHYDRFQSAGHIAGTSVDSQSVLDDLLNRIENSE